MDVMFYEVFEEEKKALNLFLPREVEAGFTEKKIQAAGDKKPPAPLISIRTQSVVPGIWAGSFEGILTRSTGYDHILSFFQRAGVPALAGYLPYYCARAVAEHAILVMLSLYRKLKTQIDHFNRFDRNGLTGRECLGKNMLVVGVGHVGSQVAEMALELKMNVKGVDIDPKMKDLEHISLKDGIPWADVIVCALPLTEETAGMFTYETLKDAKRGAVFVNISRGEISPTGDLKELLADGILGGIGLDVYEDEHTLAECLRGVVPEEGRCQHIVELQDKENVIFTPHNAFNTGEALERKAEQSIESVRLFLEKKVFPHPVPEK